MNSYFFEKAASSSLGEAEALMRDIYEEDPSYWKHGLSTEAMDGGLYLVREASTKEPVGFVGWQDRWEGMNKVGYYSIGIKKEHRRKGYAQEAVGKIIREKAAGVDQVRAYISDHNEPSIELAKKLDVPLELTKAASVKEAKGGLFRGSGLKGLGNVAIGTGAAGAGAYGGKLLGDLESKHFDYIQKNKNINSVLNAIIGATLAIPGRTIRGGYRPTLLKSKMLATGGFATKEMGLGAKDTYDRYIDTQQDLVDTQLDTAKKEEESANVEKDTADIYKNLVDSYGGVALGGAGLLGLAAVLAMWKNSRGSGKKDVLSVDIPKDKMSDKFYNQLSRDLLFDSPKEKKRKLQMLLSQDPSDPMLVKMLENKRASTEGMEKQAMGLLARGGMAALSGLKALPKSMYRSTIAGLPGFNRAAGSLAPNRAGRHFGSMVKGNLGLQGVLGGADALTGTNPFGNDGMANWQRRMLFDPFKDTVTHWKNSNDPNWGNDEDRSKARWDSVKSGLWSIPNMYLGGSLGSSLARPFAAVARGRMLPFMGARSATPLNALQPAGRNAWRNVVGSGRWHNLSTPARQAQLQRKIAQGTATTADKMKLAYGRWAGGTADTLAQGELAPMFLAQGTVGKTLGKLPVIGKAMTGLTSLGLTSPLAFWGTRGGRLRQATNTASGYSALGTGMKVNPVSQILMEHGPKVKGYQKWALGAPTGPGGLKWLQQFNAGSMLNPMTWGTKAIQTGGNLLPKLALSAIPSMWVEQGMAPRWFGSGRADDGHPEHLSKLQRLMGKDQIGRLNIPGTGFMGGFPGSFIGNAMGGYGYAGGTDSEGRGRGALGHDFYAFPGPGEGKGGPKDTHYAEKLNSRYAKYPSLLYRDQLSQLLGQGEVTEEDVRKEQPWWLKALLGPASGNRGKWDSSVERQQQSARIMEEAQRSRQYIKNRAPLKNTGLDTHAMPEVIRDNIPGNTPGSSGMFDPSTSNDDL